MKKFNFFTGILFFLVIANSDMINHVCSINLYKGNYSRPGKTDNSNAARYNTPNYKANFFTGPDSLILTSGTINLAIPDENANGATSTLNASGISGSAVVDSIIVEFTIPHPFLLDVFVNLEAPNGEILNLVADHDCGDVLGYQQTRITSDGSYPNIDPITIPPITGTFKADAKTQNDLDTDPNNNSLVTVPSVTTTTYSGLFTTPNGDWKLHVYDVAAGDVGELTDWSIKIRYHINGPLPVSLFTFSGYREGNNNLLKWSTASEQNNRGFQLERSLNGIDFTPISFINSQATFGNSSSQLNYAYIDNNPQGDKQYYRLRQIDFDAKEKLSNIVLIKGISPKDLTIDAVFPNPANSSLNIFVNAPHDDDISIQVIDMNGKMLKQKNAVAEKGSNTLSVDVTSLNSGVYLLKIISSSGESAITRFIKQ